MDVLDISLRHEKEAINLYEYLVKQASLESVKRLFSSLLEDERKHYKRIAYFRATLDDTTGWRNDEHEFSRHFSHIARDAGIEGLCGEEVNFYREVMDYEKNGINRYEYYLCNTGDMRSRKLLTDIISREKKHFDIIKELCVFISEQQSFR